MKGHSAAAGLAGGSCGREASVPCARVAKRRQQRGGGPSRVSLELRGSAWLSVSSSAPRRPFPPPRGRRVGSSGLSAERGVLQAARTTALVAAVTTASAGGEDERVRKGEGQQAGARRAGGEGRGPADRESAACEERLAPRPGLRGGTSPGSSVTRLREGAEA